MKSIALLIVVVLASACSDRDDARDSQSTQQPAPEASAPAPEPVPTAGEQPPQPESDRAPTPNRAAAEPIEVRDARAAAAGSVTRRAEETGVNADAAVLGDFKSRVDKYVDLHEDAAKGDGKLTETKESAEISSAQDTLAARIVAARSNAKQGDIFTPEIRNRFRRLLAPELKGEDGRDARAVMKDDAPAPGSIPFKVNAKYPEGQPRPTVPSNVLRNLPTLPKPLEYRVIGRHLLLLDTDAGLIVDYIPNAIS